MLKTLSATLLAVSVLAAPALAAGQSKTAPTPVIKAEQVKQTKQVKQLKPNALNANASMGQHRNVRHHRHHKHVGAVNTHKFSDVTVKHISPAAKRG
jgi:hypothetical protein